MNVIKLIEKFWFNFKNPLITQFFRLTPNNNGRIYFYNRETKKIFHVHSRGYVDSLVADQIYTNHDYRVRFRSQDASDEYLRIVKSGGTPLIIDCGSNIGISSKFFAERYPHALIVSVEPDYKNMELALKNCSGLNNVEFIEGAVGDSHGKVKIANPMAEPWAFQMERVEDDFGIQLYTINQILEAHSECTPYLIKIDIEGFENDLFRSNTDWINNFYIMIIELHDWLRPKTANSQNFLKAVSQLNRDFVYVGENIFSMKN